MLRDVYFIDDLKISKYKDEDEDERLQTIKESIEDLKEWLHFFNTQNMESDNKNWLRETQNNWNKGIEYCFKISSLNSDRQLGEVRINHINNSHKFANITYFVRSSEKGKGIISRVVKKVIEICLSELQLNRVELYMSVNNSASKKIAEKVGAKLEGVMRQRVVCNNKIEDAYLYSIIKSDL